VTINKDEEGLFEIFTNLGKAGGCPSQSEATARVLSVAVRYLRLDLDGSSDSKQTLKYYRDRGELVAIRIGRKNRYRRRDLDDFLSKKSKAKRAR